MSNWVAPTRSGKAEKIKAFDDDFDEPIDPENKVHPKTAEGYIYALKSLGRLNESVALAFRWQDRWPSMRQVFVALTHMGVTIVLVTQRAERAGHRLDLTAKEQALLVLFLRYPGEVLSRTRIYEQIWEDRYDGLSNTLEVHIKELRRKLEVFGPRLIATVRGRGYVFGEQA